MPLGFLAAPWPSFAAALGSPGGTPIYLCLSPTSPWRVARLANLLHGQASYSFYSSSFSLESYTFKNSRSQKTSDFRGKFHLEMSTKKRNFAFWRAATREGKQLVQQAARAMANRPTASFEEKVRVREN